MNDKGTYYWTGARLKNDLERRTKPRTIVKKTQEKTTEADERKRWEKTGPGLRLNTSV